MRWWIFGALFGLVVVFVFVGEHGNLIVAQSRPGQQQQTVDGHATDGIAQLGWYLFSVGTEEGEGRLLHWGSLFFSRPTPPRPTRINKPRPNPHTTHTFHHQPTTTHNTRQPKLKPRLQTINPERAFENRTFHGCVFYSNRIRRNVHISNFQDWGGGAGDGGAVCVSRQFLVCVCVL